MSKANTVYYELPENINYTDSSLERLAERLIDNRFKIYNHFDLLTIYFHTKSHITQPFAMATYQMGKLVFINRLAYNRKQEAGKKISNRLVDLEKEYRQGAVKDYLSMAYQCKQPFMYIRIDYSDDIIENQLLSSQVNIENAKQVKPTTEIKDGKKVLGDGEVIDDGYRITKGKEFSSDLNELFLLRCEDSERVGVNEIHIPRKSFTDAIDSLSDDLMASLYMWLYPDDEPPRGKAIQTIYKTKGYNHKYRKKQQILKAIVDYLVELN